MKFLYEKGDKVIVLATGAYAIVTETDLIGEVPELPTVVELDNGDKFYGKAIQQELRPVFDTAILLAGLTDVARIFIGMSDTFLQEPGYDAVAQLAEDYNQAYLPDDEADYEVKWVKSLADVTREIKAANGEDDEDANDLICADCMQPMIVNEDGTTNHLVPESQGVDKIDHDADADHVARAVDEDEPPFADEPSDDKPNEDQPDPPESGETSEVT